MNKFWCHFSSLVFTPLDPDPVPDQDRMDIFWIPDPQHWPPIDWLIDCTYLSFTLSPMCIVCDHVSCTNAALFLYLIIALRTENKICWPTGRCGGLTHFQTADNISARYESLFYTFMILMLSCRQGAMSMMVACCQEEREDNIAMKRLDNEDEEEEDEDPE